MIGMWRCEPFSLSRMAAVAAKPSRIGIWMSIRIRSKSCSLKLLQRLLAIVGERNVVAALRQKLDGHLLIHHAILGQQNSSRRKIAGSVVDRIERSRSATAVPSDCEIALNSCDCVTGFVKQRATPSSAARRLSSLRPADDSMITVASSKCGSFVHPFDAFQIRPCPAS